MDGVDERGEGTQGTGQENGMKHPSAELLLGDTEAKQDPVRPPRL